MTIEPDRQPETGLHRRFALILLAFIALASGYTLMIAIHRPPLAELAGGLLLSTPQRNQLLLSLLLGTFVAATLMAITLHRNRVLDRWPQSPDALAAGLWPVTLIPIALNAFDPRVWLDAPLMLYAITIAACMVCVKLTVWPPAPTIRQTGSFPHRRWPILALILAISAYVVQVSIHTILNHKSLGTGAFDLGLQENVLWNTLNGDFLFSALMDSHYFGVHTSFVLLPIALIYALLPATETLLVLQTLAIALAAWPLFLLSRRILGNESHALIISLIWLTHPAVAGANFFDFHPTVFAPVLAFSAFYFWQCRRWSLFWTMIVLLLMVKEDLSIMVVLLGLVILKTEYRRQGLLLVAVGTLAYITLQHGVIPHFAGGDHSYSWYYTEMIPPTEGPRGLVTTVLLSPIHCFKVALTGDKILYIFQLFAPLAFLPFLTARGWLLMSYGLASAMLATRPALNQLGFHYSLPLLGMAFLAALLALEKRPPDWRNRAITAAVMLAVVTCFHYGMIWPRHNFSGGFSRVDFNYSQDDRARYTDLVNLVALIPDDASVLANEELVPHVARRHTIETERYVGKRQAFPYDYILINGDKTVDSLRDVPSLNDLEDYRVVGKNQHFVLYERHP